MQVYMSLGVITRLLNHNMTQSSQQFMSGTKVLRCIHVDAQKSSRSMLSIS